MSTSFITEEPFYYGYRFTCYDGKVVSQGKDNMNVIFDRTEILRYLIHGHPEFKKPDLIIENGCICVDFTHYYICAEYLVRWFRALLDYGSVSESVIEQGYHLGGSNYLESKLIENTNKTPVKNILYPCEDVDEVYLWKQNIITTASQKDIEDIIKERENDGYILITKIRPNITYPFDLIFRKKNNNLI